MVMFLYLFGVLAVTAIGTYVTGRAIAGALNIAWLERRSAENTLAAAMLGTAAWMLITAYSSYLGLTAPQALPVTAAAIGTLIAMLLRQRRLGWLLPPTQARVTRPLICFFITAAALGMSSVLLGNFYHCNGDTSFYVAASDWLQISSACEGGKVDPHRPLSHVGDWARAGWFRFGAIYFHSLIQAIFFRFRGIELFPAVMCWGVLLNIGAMFVLGRWTLRMTRPQAGVSAAIALVFSTPLSLSGNHGFLCQVYGTAAVVFAIAVLSRLYVARNQTLSSAITISLAVAMVLSAYSEIAPVLAIAAAAYVVQAFGRARRRGRLPHFAWFVVQTSAALAVIGNIEFIHAVKAILYQSKVNGVGCHIPWDPASFWAFALGLRPHKFDSIFIAVPCAVVGSYFLALGLQKMRRRANALPLVVALGVMAGLAVYFQFVVRDFWTGAIGHTWNLFKICKWAYPLLAVIQGVGLFQHLQKYPRYRPVIVRLCTVVFVLMLPIRMVEAWRLSKDERRLFESARPFEALRDFQRQLQARKPESLYVIGRESLILNLLPMYVDPIPCLNSWRANGYIHSAVLHEDRLSEMTDKTVFIMHGRPPFEDPTARLPAGFSIVDGRRIFVTEILWEKDASSAGPQNRPKMALKMRVWSPHAGIATLNFNVNGSADARETSQLTLEVRQPDRSPRVVVVPHGGRGGAPIRVAPGMNEIELRDIEHPSAEVAVGHMVHWNLSQVTFDDVQLSTEANYIAEIENENTVEMCESGKFCWIGKKPVKLRIWSPQDGIAPVRFVVHPGPSKADLGSRKLRVTCDKSRVEVDSPPNSTLTAVLQLSAGFNDVLVDCLDEPDVAGSAADGRILLARMSQISVGPTTLMIPGDDVPNQLAAGPNVDTAAPR